MDKTPDILEESTLSYSSVDDRNIFLIIDAMKQGIKFPQFASLTKHSPFSLNDWSDFLHLSERTMQRYKKEQKTFDRVSSEKIIEIVLIYRYGSEVFGNSDKFNAWLETINIALGGRKPKEFLDNTFGISLLKDELTRIEHGILA